MRSLITPHSNGLSDREESVRVKENTFINTPRKL